jgi:hypothetical protein
VTSGMKRIRAALGASLLAAPVAAQVMARADVAAADTIRIRVAEVFCMPLPAEAGKCPIREAVVARNGRVERMQMEAGGLRYVTHFDSLRTSPTLVDSLVSALAAAGFDTVRNPVCRSSIMTDHPRVTFTVARQNIRRAALLTTDCPERKKAFGEIYRLTQRATGIFDWRPSADSVPRPELRLAGCYALTPGEWTGSLENRFAVPPVVRLGLASVALREGRFYILTPPLPAHLASARRTRTAVWRPVDGGVELLWYNGDYGMRATLNARAGHGHYEGVGQADGHLRGRYTYPRVTLAAVRTPCED